MQCRSQSTFSKRCGPELCASATQRLRVKTITRSELALRNGVDKPEVWIAYKGIVYDVTKSRLWFTGKHYEHWAGQDLTDELPDAPHAEEVFMRFAAIGELKP